LHPRPKSTIFPCTGEKMLVITAIRPEVIRKIRARGEGTLELWSVPNVIAAESLRPGDVVFLTEEAEEDVKRGVEGIVVRVDRVNVDYRRTGNHYGDEWEVKAARMRVSLVGTARVSQVTGGRTLVANVDMHDHLIIG